MDTAAAPACAAGSSAKSAPCVVDPRACTEAYLQRHQLREILQALLAELLFAKPADPRQHIVAALEKAKVVGCKPLLDAGDLGAIFGMLDITQRGTVSQQQATSTLSTVIGSAALQQQQQQQQQRQQQQAASTGAAAASNLDKQQFVSYMHTALCAATPLCKVTQPSSHAVVLGEDV